MTKSAEKPNASKRSQPPVESQFKRGQSGNPAGRPKGSRNRVTRGRFDRMVLEEAERAAPGGSGVSAHRAVLRALYGDAGLGSLGAANLILSLVAKAEATVAGLDAAAEAGQAEAAAADRRRAEVVEDDALATQLAAVDRELYRLARKFAPLNDRSPKPMRFVDAVAKARAYAVLKLDFSIDYDPFDLAALLAEYQAAELEASDSDHE